MVHGTYSLWLGPYGWGIFFVAFIIAIIMFAVKKKFYPVMYLISIATYVFTVGFVIDAFHLSKEWILLLLALSAVIFIGLGFDFSRKYDKKKSKFSSSIPVKRK
jgi:membrane protein implicated in regulation of membrane protease activity